MTKISIDLIESVKATAQELVREAAWRLPHLHYADLRLEVTEAPSDEELEMLRALDPERRFLGA